MDKFTGVVSNITTISHCSVTIDGNAMINAHSYSGTIQCTLRNVTLPFGTARTLNNMISAFNGMHVKCTVVSIQQTPGAYGSPPIITVDMALDSTKTHSALPPVYNGPTTGVVTLGGGNGNKSTTGNGLPTGGIQTINGGCPPGYTLAFLPGTNTPYCMVN